MHALTTEVVALGVPAPDDDDDDDESGGEGGEGAGGESSDDGYGAGLGDVLAELNAASAAARPPSTAAHKRAPWRFGPALGGETLHLVASLHTRTRGNPRAAELYAHLLLRAAQPYARTLVGWVEKGELDDPWDEFCVREQRGYGMAAGAGGGGREDEGFTDEYWERRYTLRGDRAAGSAGPSGGGGSSRAHGKAPLGGGHGLSSAASAAGARGLGDRPRERGLARGAVVPDFLEPWLDKVLLAGKYLNVIRECGIEVEVPPSAEGGTERDDGLIDMQEEGCVGSLSCSLFPSHSRGAEEADDDPHRPQVLPPHRDGLYVRQQDAPQAAPRGGAPRVAPRVRPLSLPLLFLGIVVPD